MTQAEEAHRSPLCQPPAVLLPGERRDASCWWLCHGHPWEGRGQQEEAAPGRGELPQLPALCAHSPAGATSARCAPRSPARAQCPAQSPPCAFVASPGDAQCQGTAVTVLSHSLAPGLPPPGSWHRLIPSLDPGATRVQRPAARQDPFGRRAGAGTLAVFK